MAINHNTQARRQAHVALIQGDDRVQNLEAALALVLDEVPWSQLRRVVVKPNLVVSTAPHAITHRDALEVVLAMVRSRYQGPLIVAEGCAVESTWEAFRRHGYPALADQYRCELVDLNSDDTETLQVLDKRCGPLLVRMAKTLLTSDCRVSLSVPKTHDSVMFTGTIKNLIMAGLVNRRVAENPSRPWWLDMFGRLARGHGNGWGSDKVAMHQPPAIMNANLALVAPLVWPHVAVLDGFVAMEGAGPVYGSPVDWRVAMAGLDALAVDATALRLMGFQLEEIGYLYYCARRELGCHREEDIHIAGNVSPETVRRVFLRHPQEAAQRRWRVEDPPLDLTPVSSLSGTKMNQQGLARS